MAVTDLLAFDPEVGGLIAGTGRLGEPRVSAGAAAGTA